MGLVQNIPKSGECDVIGNNTKNFQEGNIDLHYQI